MDEARAYQIWPEDIPNIGYFKSRPYMGLETMIF